VSAAVAAVLADRQAVIDRVSAYGWALDDRDWQALAACFGPHGEADYGERLGTHVGGDAVAAFCRRLLDPLDSTQHVISNHQVTLGGERATLRCHVVAQHTRAAAAGGANYLIGASYHVDLVRAGESWQIRRLALQVRWQDGNPGVLGDA
jgi:SnoaL-like domain